MCVFPGPCDSECNESGCDGPGPHHCNNCLHYFLKFKNNTRWEEILRAVGTVQTLLSWWLLMVSRSENNSSFFGWFVCYFPQRQKRPVFSFSLDSEVLRQRRSSSKRSHWFKPNKRDTCTFVLVFILFLNLLIQDPSPWDPPGTESAVIAFVLVGLCTNQRQDGFVHVVIRPLLEVWRWGPAPFALLHATGCLLLVGVFVETRRPTFIVRPLSSFSVDAFFSSNGRKSFISSQDDISSSSPERC